MIDYFALLEQPRRPWLDPEELKQRYQQLTRISHPDRQKGETDFAAVNEAYRVLINPKLRLQHLMSLEGETPAANETTPLELINLFSQTGIIIQEVDRLLEKLKGKNNALTRSLLQSEILATQKRSNDILNKLKDLQEVALRDLRALSERWSPQPKKVTGQLKYLYHRISYLMRWIDQIEERLFQLSI